MREQITLCIIAGNVEQYIERFLRSFAPLVGRVVIVRACGHSRHDNTLIIASDVCRELGVQVDCGHYFNGFERAEWPHIDDFASARNKAFAAAETDWIAWADTDDIIDPASIESIHATLAKHGESLDALSLDYEVPEDGLTVLKERIIRRGSGKWRWLVHEEFVFDAQAPRIARVPGARIVHAPIGERKVNDERNVRLLESMGDDMPTGHRFHYVNSLRAVGRMGDSMKELARLLQDKSLAAPERYELFMSASQMATDPAQCGQMLLQAFGTDPERREAPGELALYSLRTGRLREALSWTRIMRSMPRPPEYLWNARGKYYGWLGVQLHAWALRANGDLSGAAAHELNHFTANGAKISLLHATRGRAKQAHQCKLRWYDSASDPDAIEHIFALDSDDDTGIALSMQRNVVVEAGGGCVRAWNAAAQASSGQVLIQLSDDWNPPHHWDRMILERLGDLSASKVLAVSDGHRTDDLLCMAILTRARYQEQGYMFHPDFLSVYSDNYFTHCAYRDGVVVEGRGIIFEHQHPAFSPEVQWDQTYLESNAEPRYVHGKAVFDQLIESEQRA